MNRLHRLQQQTGVPIAVALLPSRDPGSEKDLAPLVSELKAARIPIINISDRFHEQMGPKAADYFLTGDSVHYRERGSRLVADLLTKQLKPLLAEGVQSDAR